VKKLSYGIINTRLAAIKKFYEMNDRVFNWKEISSYLPDNIRVNKDRAYTIQEIQNILTKCDERMRVVILLLGNPGQCQKFLNGPAFDIDKKLAHDICID
jgi:hypothetical protein